jgi:Mce-associated membrane protein
MDKQSGLSTEERRGGVVESSGPAADPDPSGTADAAGPDAAPSADTPPTPESTGDAGAEVVSAAEDKPSSDKPSSDKPDTDKPDDSGGTAPGTTAATTEPPAPAVTARRRPLARWVRLSAALGAVLLVLLVAAGVLFLHNRSTADVAHKRAAALSAAVQIATDLTSVDARSAPDQVKVLTAESIAPYGKDISSYVTALQSALRQAQASSRGAVTGAGIESINGDTASALVIVRATVSSAQTPNVPPVSYRIGMRLQRVDNRWLASDITFVR